MMFRSSQINSYDPYGNRLSGNSTIDFQFKGEQPSADTGLTFMRARYYDPSTGRFISRDPVEGVLNNPQSQNGYSYAHNDPINKADPSGLWYIDVGVSSGIIGPFGGGFGAQVNGQGITSYVSGGAVTLGKGVTVTYSDANPQPNTTTINLAANYIGAGSVSYPFVNEVVPLNSGEVAIGVGYPAGASFTINRTFGTYCWK